MTAPTPELSGSRGPADHAVRMQILAAARKQFSHFGYEKTTVSDVAREIGFSKAYIYRFFESKQAVAEAVNDEWIRELERDVDGALAYSITPTERLRTLFASIVASSARQHQVDRRMFDIAATSAVEGWTSFRRHEGLMADRLQAILCEGREGGDFETGTPLNEVVRAIMQMMQPFTNPSMLQHNLGVLPAGLIEATSLAIRSLTK